MSAWNCEKCTYSNKDSHSTCEICQNPRNQVPSQSNTPQGNWCCAACSFSNHDVMQSCEICHSKRNTNSGIPPQNSPITPIRGKSAARRQSSVFSPDSKSWLCESCNNRNSISKTQCAKCNQTRQHWNCIKCTFKNELRELQCKVCEEPSHLPMENRGAHSPHEIVDLTESPNSMTSFLERHESETVDNLRLIDENEARETCNRIIAYCTAHKTNFVDDSFPPLINSIGNLGRGEGDSRNVNNHKSPTVWRRPADIFTRDGRKHRWSVFRDPKPSDIMQGILGNCWFVVALALVAERPEILENIMISKQYSHHGVYQVRLCIDGEWRIVIVDDFFPCNSGGSFAFSEGRNNQLWVPLIEKALAKAYGSYGALIAGTSREGLNLVTGAPCETISLGDADNSDEIFDADLVWAKLLSAREAKYLMGCSCGCKANNPPQTEYDHLGLISKHAYSLLDVTDFNGTRLIKLRNPWGSHVWKGEWSNSSNLWTKSARNALNYNRQETGVFWIPFVYFCRYFDSVDVCKIHCGWRELRLQYPIAFDCLPNSVKATRLTIMENGEVDLMLHKQGYRQTNQNDTSRMDLIIMVFTEKDHGSLGKLVGSTKRKIASFVNLSLMLHPGKYIVIATAFNNFGLTNNYKDTASCLLSTHSHKIVIGEIFCPEPRIIGDALIKLAIENGQTTRQLEGVCIYTMTSKFGGMLIVAMNLTQDMILTVDSNCEGSTNVVSCRGTLVTRDVVPPSQIQVLNVLSQLEASSSYSINHRTNIRLSPSQNILNVTNFVRDIWTTISNNSRVPRIDPNFEVHFPQITNKIQGIFAPRELS